jgi:hypothetical protein
MSIKQRAQRSCEMADPATAIVVIACDKRKAFAQESVSDEAIQRAAAWIASLTLAMTGGSGDYWMPRFRGA